MSKLVIQETWPYLGILLGVGLLLTATSPLADDSQCDEFRHCSLTEDSAARLACYDIQSGRQQPADKDLESATTGSLDDLGSESVEREIVDAPTLRATVTRCRKDGNGKYHFYFRNGQVWKQTDRKRLKYKSCEFDITISKDFFGYRMQADGGKSRIRITRVK